MGLLAQIMKLTERRKTQSASYHG